MEVTLFRGKDQRIYWGEWIAFRSFEESDNPEGEVVLYNKDRRTFDKEPLQPELTGVYITFANPPVPEGYSVIFIKIVISMHPQVPRKIEEVI